MYNYNSIIFACLLAILLSCSGNFEEIPYESRAKASSVASSSSSEVSSSSTEESSSSSFIASSSSEKPSSSSEPSSSSSSCPNGSYKSEGTEKCYGSMADKAENKYKTVVIGTQTWMAENMNYETDSGNKCPNDNLSHCTEYGRLYTWEIAGSVCPSGWHLPNNGDWDELRQYISELKCSGATDCNVGKFLRDKSWDSGTDDFGFSALPSGNENNGNFSKLGAWWSSSDGINDNRRINYIWKIPASNIDILQQSNVLKESNSMNSVRCVKRS
ncbi:MAG: hypothetical protein LBC87_11085 [Fibromonadaceae bacterium]|jgi:uncharacterized protein (TIGR02145 family)|nr:hypothetical protein [Fibromonadaceae bacterium]